MEKEFKKLLIIYNAKAGLGNQHVHFMSAIEYLTVNHFEVTVYPVVPEEGITSEWILKKVGHNFEYIIVCGGDGTLNHAVNGLINEHITCPIGYLPVGSTNDFSKSLYGNGSHSFIDVCQWLVNGKVYQFDTGKFNDLYFNYVAGFGAFPMVSYTTPQDMKNSLGYLAYVLNFLQSIPDGLSYKKHCRIVHDGVVEEGDFMVGLITNTTQVAGVKPSVIKDSSLDDGVFEATLVKADLSAIEIGQIIHSLNNEDFNTKALIKFSFRNASFSFDGEVPWTLDGENGGMVERAEISVIPKAVSIYVPENS